jgi:hypothetical protein
MSNECAGPDPADEQEVIVTKPIKDENLEADADADLGAVGVETGTQQAGAGSIGRQAVSAAENIADIGQAEQYIGQLVRKARNAEDYDQALRQLNVQALANAQALANRQNQMAANHDQFALDRQWNIDEVSMAALSASIAIAVADALKTK